MEKATRKSLLAAPGGPSDGDSSSSPASGLALSALLTAFLSGTQKGGKLYFGLHLMDCQQKLEMTSLPGYIKDNF